MEEDLEILNQLLNGNHLSQKEVIKASNLLHSLEIELESRCNR